MIVRGQYIHTIAEQDFRTMAAIVACNPSAQKAAGWSRDEQASICGVLISDGQGKIVVTHKCVGKRAKGDEEPKVTCEVLHEVL